MTADPILLQMKYARVVQLFAEEAHLTSEKALDLFYHSQTYALMSRGISDMHCMSDGYLSDCLKDELDKSTAASCPWNKRP